MAKRKWILLYRKEGEQPVWLYEPLQKHDLQARLNKGWRIWQR